MYKYLLLLYLSFNVLYCFATDDSSPRFVLETHSVNTGHSEVPVTFKLDTTTGDIWRFSDPDFVQVPVAGTWSSGIDQRTEEEKEEQRRNDEVIKKMKETIILEIEFRQANINDVVQFLQEASSEYDPEKKGINIILNLGSSQAIADSSEDPFADPFESEEGDVSEYNGVPLITFSVRDISVYEALKIVTKVSNCRFKIVDGVVMIIPWNCVTEEVICRMYDIMPSTVKRINAFWEELQGTNSLPSSSVERKWKDVFSEYGIIWPSDTSIKLFLLTGKVLICNSRNNLNGFESVLQGINYYPPHPRRFRLLNINMKAVPELLLIDSDTGYTWQYKINKYNVVDREIDVDTFMSIPVRKQKN